MLLKFKVDGMGCSACCMRVQNAALNVPGVTSATALLAEGLLQCEAPGNDAAASICAAVGAAGYTCQPLLQ